MGMDIDMVPMKINDMIRLLESNGFALIRSGHHRVYAHGAIKVVLSHGRIVSPGVVRGALRSIEQAKNREKVYA